MAALIAYFVALLAPLATMLAVTPTAASASCFRSEQVALLNTKEARWNYTGTGGPFNWHGVNSTEYKLCARGRNQSPINIVPGAPGIDELGDKTQRPRMDYPPNVLGAVLWNTGLTLEVKAKDTQLDKAYLTFDGARWALDQFHFHTPSEHRLRDEHFPMEVHFVHKFNGTLPGSPERPHSQLLVLGFFLDFPGPSSEEWSHPLDEVLRLAPEVAARDATVNIGPLYLQVVEYHVWRFPLLRYNGSLTTPPCHENVTWLVSSEPLTLKVATYSAAKKVLRFNSRPTQNTPPGEPNLIEVAAASLAQLKPLS